MPAQQRARRHEPLRAQRRRPDARQCRQHRPVRPRQPRTAGLTAQYRVLMTKHQDLCVLDRIAASQQRQPAGHLAEDEIQQAEAHERLACRTLYTISPTVARSQSQALRKTAATISSPDRIPSSPRCDGFWVGTGHTPEERCRSVPVPPIPCRAQGPDPTDEPRTNDQEARLPSGNRASDLHFLVAGAGFEPATSGL